MRRWLLVIAGAIATILVLSAPAAAQDEGDDGDEGSTTEVRGVLRTTDDAGEDVFLEGVEFVVTDADGNEVGRTVTDAEGVWSVPLPGEGTYSALLVEETLPEGNALRNPENNPLTFDVNDGDSRSTLFPLGEAAGAVDNTLKSVQLFVDGIKFGLIIAMCAVGLSMIFGTTGLVNFAHGEMVTFGAMVAYLFNVTGVFGWQSSLIVGGIAAFLVTGVAGAAFNASVWRPLRNSGASLIAALVVSIGASIFFRYVMLYFFTGRDGFYRDYRIQDKWDFYFFTLAPKDLFLIVFATLLLLAVGLALQKTRAGKAMRAVSDNRDLAESSGIDVERVITWVWVSGSALAGIGGVLFGLTEAVNWQMGFRILLLMFAGMILGGLGTAYGALLGSLIVGVFIQMSTLVIPNEMKNVGALVTMVIILLVRPQGLLGRAERVG